MSQNGREVYSRGFGYTDVENGVKATSRTLARISSVSKPVSCVLAAKLFENGRLDLDKPVEYYMTELPPLKFNGRKVQINLILNLFVNTAQIATSLW